MLRLHSKYKKIAASFEITRYADNNFSDSMWGNWLV